MAYILVDTLRRVGLRHSQLADAAVATIRLKLLELGAQVRTSVRRIHFAIASGCPDKIEFAYLSPSDTPYGWRARANRVMLMPDGQCSYLLWSGLACLFRSRVRLQAEILVLRHQINVLRGKSPKRLVFGTLDRLLSLGCIASLLEM
jgi:Transposase DDE domain group 1